MKPCKINKRYKGGFTLIELLIVLVLVSIVSLMSISFYARFFSQNAVTNSVDQLVGQIRKAQIYSMMGRQNGGVWGVAYVSNKITLFQGVTYATRNPALDESFTIHANITITGFSEIAFAHATGTPSVSPTIIISSNNNTKTITINPMGVASR